MSPFVFLTLYSLCHRDWSPWGTDGWQTLRGKEEGKGKCGGWVGRVWWGGVRVWVRGEGKSKTEDKWLADPLGVRKWGWVWVWGNGKSESKDKWFAEFSTSKYLNIKQKIIRIHQIFHFFMHILKVSSHSEFGHSRGSRFSFYSYIIFLPHSYPIATIPPWNVITICIKLFFITRWNNLAVLDLKQFPSFLLYEKSLFGSTPLASSLK